MNNDEDNDLFAGFVAGLTMTAIGALLISTILLSNKDVHWRDAAVKHKAAEYYLDDKHQRQWRWTQ